MQIDQAQDSANVRSLRSFGSFGFSTGGQLEGVVIAAELQMELRRLDQALRLIADYDGQAPQQVQRFTALPSRQLQSNQGNERIFRIRFLQQRLAIGVDGF